MTPSSLSSSVEAAWPDPSDDLWADEPQPWRGPPASAWVLVAVTLATLGPMLLAVVLASP